jgi:hypothetical protein
MKDDVRDGTRQKWVTINAYSILARKSVETVAAWNASVLMRR